MDKPPLWTRDFIIITCVNIFVALNFFLLMPVISLFVIDRFHASPGAGGLATGLYVFGALIARIMFGKWIEFIGRKRFLLIGTAFSLAMSLVYFFIDSLPLLMLVRFLHGAAFGINNTLTATIVAQVVPRERRGEGLGFFALSATFATATGPYIAMYLSRHGSYNLIFLACAIASALSLIGALCCPVEEVELTKDQLKETKGFHLSGLFEFKVIPVALVRGGFFFCYSSVLAFVAAYAREIGLAEAARFFFLVYAISIFLSRPFTGRLLDVKGDNFVMYPAFLIFIAGMIVLTFAHHGITLLAAGALFGIGLGVVQIGCQTIGVRIAPPHRLGLANSTLGLFTDLATGIGPSILGLFVPYMGFRGLYVCAAALALVFSIMYYYLHGRITRA